MRELLSEVYLEKGLLAQLRVLPLWFYETGQKEVFSRYAVNDLHMSRYKWQSRSICPGSNNAFEHRQMWLLIALLATFLLRCPRSPT